MEDSEDEMKLNLFSVVGMDAVAMFAEIVRVAAIVAAAPAIF